MQSDLGMLMQSKLALLEGKSTASLIHMCSAQNEGPIFGTAKY